MLSEQTHGARGFFPVESSSAKIRRLPVAAAQTLKRGDMVILSSGQIAIALAASGELAGVIAEDSAAQAENTLVDVYADPETVFVGRADGALALADALNSLKEIDITGATGAMMIDANASATDVLLIVEQYDTREDLTAAGAQWKFKINKHAFANTST